MNCDDSLEILYQFIDQDLETGVTQEIVVHLKRCRSCWDRYEFEKKLIEHVRRCCHKEDPSDALLSRIHSLLEKF